jgi:hypothetical protein
MFGRLLAVRGPVQLRVPMCVLWASVQLSCASPTLPLPPPSLVQVMPGVDADHIRLSGPCGATPPNAIIVVLNENPSVPLDERGASTLTDPSCGKWDVNVFAHSKDALEVWYEDRGAVSQSAYVIVP